MNKIIDKRYEFVILFDVSNGNPNGDPDHNNMPRVDWESGKGIVTNGCLKRKIRNYVDLVKGDVPGFRIYIQEGTSLNQKDQQVLEYLSVDKDLKNAKKRDPGLDEKLRDAVCANFFDIRTFGAVMTTFVKGGLNCGQIRGPVQIVDALSVEPVMVQPITITRSAVTTQADAERKMTEMGQRYIIPYGLYRAHGFVSANLAQKTTGFSEEDLALLWQAILNMFEHERSALRGAMAVRELIIFEHESILGNAPAHKLFDLVQIKRKKGDMPARAYEDYIVDINLNQLPSGVKCIRMEG